MLTLKRHLELMQKRCLVFGDILKSEIKECPHARKLLLSDFKLDKGQEKAFTLKSSLAQLCQRSLVDNSSLSVVLLLFFKDRSFDVALRHGVRVDVSLKDLPAIFDLSLSLFKLEVGVP